MLTLKGAWLVCRCRSEINGAGVTFPNPIYSKCPIPPWRFLVTFAMRSPLPEYVIRYLMHCKYNPFPMHPLVFSDYIDREKSVTFMS